LWLKDPQHRTYNKLNFLPPPVRCPADVYNLFQGFAAEKWDVESSGDISVWKELLMLASNNDPTSARIIEIFFADIIQRPGQPSQAGWSTSSHARGSGKDTLMETMQDIIGCMYFTCTASPAQELLGTHAIGLMHKLVVHVNESEDLRAHAGQVRHLLTAKKVEVNQKYVRQIKVVNLARWVVTGNDTGLVETNRRFFATQFSKERVGDTEFWSRVFRWKEDKRNLKAVFEHLLTLDLSAVNNIQALFNSHATSAARLAALRTADDITQWAVYRVEVHQAACDNAAHAHQPAPATVKVMTSAELYQDYVHWGESRAWTKGTASAHTYNAFTQQLRYRYGSNKAPGQGRPPLHKVINIGRERLAGW
jgi:phage/plasmid-associated DNA primase